MTTGISTNRRLTDKARALRAAGVEFVFRYYCSSQRNPKLLEAAEARALSAAGLRIGVVFQDFNNAPERFSAEIGRSHGRNAVARAEAVGQPPRSAIYFAVDYDVAREAEIARTIHPYFLGVQEGLIEAGGGTAPYAVGVYGSGSVCRWIRTQCDFVRFAWLGEATGWTGSAGYTGWNVKQSVARHSLAGLTGPGEFEDCVADGPFGAFRLGERVAVARAAQPSRLVFTMPLRDTSELVTGRLQVLGSRKTAAPLLNAEATSGRPGFQTADHLWTVGHGPLPPDVRYEVESSARDMEIGTHAGTTFRILPQRVDDAVSGQSRGDFSVHGMERAPGSAGGIVFRQGADFAEFVTLMRGARKKKLPLEVRYDGLSPSPDLVPKRAVFAMRLERSGTRIDGTLTLLDGSGRKVFAAAATSGLPGHQHRGDLWLRNHGPIPDIPDRKTIVTAEYASDRIGPAFHIKPEVFRSTGKSRDALRVHLDEGRPGSAGCIVLRDPDEFAALRRLMRRIAATVPALDLSIDYT